MSVRSREMAELPIALIKLAAQSGLFLTNAKITPQSKREYLNDYPKLSLDFVDGLTLVRELRADAILRARWLEGAGLSWPYTVSYPVLVRRHEGDLPIIPNAIHGDEVNETIASQLRAVADGANVSVVRDWAGEEDFGSYREPKSLTKEEGPLPRLSCILVKFTGLRSISTLEDLQKKTARSFVEALTPLEARFSIVVGMPSLVPLAGSTSGSVIRVSNSCYAITKTLTFQAHEAVFFSLAHDKWTSITDARVTEADAIRLYNIELDACLSVNHVSPVSRAQARLNRAIRLHQLEKWKLSIFALVDTDPTTWSSESVPQPDEVIKWPWNSTWLCGWYHQTLLTGLVEFPSSDLEMAALTCIDEGEEKTRLAKIADGLRSQFGVTILDPQRARHMLATVSYDPFEEEGDILFRTADLILEEESGLPSPMLPEHRRFTVTIFLKGAPLEVIVAAIEALGARDGNINPHHKVHEYEDGCRADIALEFEPILDASTPQLLTLAHDWLVQLFDALHRDEHNVSRWTKDAWRKLTGISLGLPWQASRNVYVTIQSEDGVRNLRGIDKPLEQDWDSSD